LRAMLILAQGEDRAHTVQEIARSSRVPLDYLAKILNCLARVGLVTAQRGRGGGFQPARSADEITILEVIAAVDPIQRIRTCPLGLAAHGENLCPLHRKLDDAMRIVEEAFASTNLHSLLGEPSSATKLPVAYPLCSGEECHGAAAIR